MLKISNLHVSYGKIMAVKGIDLEVARGEIVTLIGSNGAGKTSALKSISGLVPISSGSIYFNDMALNNLKAYSITSLGIIHVPEGRGIFPNLTVKENLEIGAYLKKGGYVSDKLDEVYDMFPVLKARQKQKAGTFSGGEQQMLAIGRALMSDPKMMLLDEPSLGLAPMIVQNIFRIIGELNRNKKITILLVEQNANLALSVSHRGYIIETGVIVNKNLSSVLIHDDEVKKAYLGG